MRRLRKNTIVSAILGGIALLLFALFAMSGTIVTLVLGVVLLVSSGLSRKRESYDEYRDRYDERFGTESGEDPGKAAK